MSVLRTPVLRLIYLVQPFNMPVLLGNMPVLPLNLPVLSLNLPVLP